VTADIITIFPRVVEAALSEGVVGRARTAGTIDVRVRDLRDFTDDRHRTVDDVPFGGGPGMVMKAEPVFRAIEAIRADRGEPDAVVLMTPQGRPFTQREAERFSRLARLVLICGRYEGVDERVALGLPAEEVSIGDYVLSGGEVPALVLLEVVTRLVPGVIGREESHERDSFGPARLLDHPHYTRPAEFRGLAVPEVLRSGNHAEIERWREEAALEKTRRNRPDLLES